MWGDVKVEAKDTGKLSGMAKNTKVKILRL
jgi:hypothetical protein